jgi:tripartite-type tricarboxylate transporter receptor subunit TctC
MRSIIGGLSSIIALAITAPACAAAPADSYPSRPVRFVVPFAPGGTSDIAARLVGAKLGELLRQQFIIDNRAGAAGTIGTGLVASAAPDGYTLLSANNAVAINASLYPKLPYDALKDLAAVSLIGVTPNVLVVNPALGAASVADFVKAARAQPGKLAYGSAGVGSSSHLPVVLFETVANMTFTHVPYKGGALALIDTIAGQTQFMLATLPSAHNYVVSGRLWGLAVTGSRRSQALPELPTIAESGFPGYQYTSWYGMMARAGLPASVLKTLNEAVARALATPDLSDKLRQQGVEIEATSPHAFHELVRSETAVGAKVVKSSRIRLD